jgi:anti-sigma-K factor RskA
VTVHEQAAAFVLDALDSEEAREFEQHLRHCPDCEEQLEPLRVAATALAFAGELPRPRPELRRRVLATDPIVLPFRGRWSPPLLSAVALAACAALVLGLNRQGQAPGVSLVLGENGHVMLVAQGLPSPPPGKVYEIWITQGDQATPAGFLRGRRAELTRPVLPGTRVAVTVEPSGGSRRPTGPLLLETETA